MQSYDLQSDTSIEKEKNCIFNNQLCATDVLHSV